MTVKIASPFRIQHPDDATLFHDLEGDAAVDLWFDHYKPHGYKIAKNQPEFAEVPFILTRAGAAARKNYLEERFGESEQPESDDHDDDSSAATVIVLSDAELAAKAEAEKIAAAKKDDDKSDAGADHK